MKRFLSKNPEFVEVCENYGLSQVEKVEIVFVKNEIIVENKYIVVIELKGKDVVVNECWWAVRVLQIYFWE